MSQNPLVSVIIPTYNRKKRVARLIESVKQSSYPAESIEILIVDDASTDGTFGLIKERYPDVKVIRNTRRRMTSGSRNIGITSSKGHYLFFIDDDNVIDRNAINELVNFMERNGNVGLVGPIMYYYSVPKEIWCADGKLSYVEKPIHNIIFKFLHGKYESFHISNIYAIECDYIPNAFMVREQIIKEVGFFDEKNFPMLWEDADFSLRIKKRGYHIFIISTAKVWHDVPKAKDFHIDEERAFFRGRDRVKFYLKYEPLRLLLLPIDVFGFCGLLFLFERGSRPLEKLFQYLRGVIYGIALRD